MNNLQKHINDYLDHCRHHKMLDSKTTKAYKHAASELPRSLSNPH